MSKGIRRPKKAKRPPKRRAPQPRTCNYGAAAAAAVKRLEDRVEAMSAKLDLCAERVLRYAEAAQLLHQASGYLLTVPRKQF